MLLLLVAASALPSSSPSSGSGGSGGAALAVGVVGCQCSVSEVSMRGHMRMHNDHLIDMGGWEVTKE